MRVLVTGGAGFIGSHVAEAALGAGHDVTVIDNLSSGRRDNVPAEAAFVELDIRDEARVGALCDELRPQAISHHAAQASVAVSVREPRLDAEVNILGSIYLLEAARRHGSRFVFASTGGALYGEVPEGTRAAVTTSIRPMSPYACSKASFEHYLRAYDAAHRVPYTILRYANVYGPRQDPHGEAGVVAIFIERLLKGEPIEVNARRKKGDEGCVRDYVFVGDVIRANTRALEGTLKDDTLNVGTGIGTTTRELADHLVGLTGGDAVVRDGDYRAGDLGRSVLDVSDMVEQIGEPLSLSKGLEKTVHWFRGRFGAGA